LAAFAGLIRSAVGRANTRCGWLLRTGWSSATAGTAKSIIMVRRPPAIARDGLSFIIFNGPTFLVVDVSGDAWTFETDRA
jgi:hypothetical protein